MTRTRYAALLALALASCTQAVRAPRPQNAADHYHTAVRSLERGAFHDAVQGLTWVADRCDNHDLGVRAGILLAAASLDPRNPDRDLTTAAAAASAVLRHGARADERPLASSFYLLARELGAGYVPATEMPDDTHSTPSIQDEAPGGPVTGCGASRSLQNDTADATLPVFSGEPVPARLRALRLERGRMDATADSLRHRLLAVEVQLAEKDRELERIRRTLKP